MNAPRRPFVQVGTETARAEGPAPKGDPVQERMQAKIESREDWPVTERPPRVEVYRCSYCLAGAEFVEVGDDPDFYCAAHKDRSPVGVEITRIKDDGGMDFVAKVISAGISAQQKTENYLHDAVARDCIEAAEAGLQLVRMIEEISGGRLRPDEFYRLNKLEDKLLWLKDKGESSRRTAEGGWNR